MGLELEDDVAERPGPQAGLRIVEGGLDAELLVEGIGGQVDHADEAPEIAAGEGADAQDDFLALPDAGDVLGGHGHVDLDPGIVHQGQDAAGPTAHHGIDDVADLGVLRGDDPGERGLHDGDVEGVLGQVEPGPGLLELGGGRVEPQLDLLALLLGDGVLLDQPVHAVLVAQGVGVGRLGDGHGGLGLPELEPDRLRLELGQDLARGHPVARLDVDAGDLAADLGRNVDLGPGFERAGVGDLFRDPVPPDLEDLDGRGAEGLVGGGLRGRLLAGDGRGQHEGGRGESDPGMTTGDELGHGFLRYFEGDSDRLRPRAFSSWASEMTQS